MTEFQVKVQRQLSPPVDETVMIYDKSRGKTTILAKPDLRMIEILSRLGDRPKAYFNAQMNETGIKLLEEVEDPGSW